MEVVAGNLLQRPSRLQLPGLHRQLAEHAAAWIYPARTNSRPLSSSSASRSRAPTIESGPPKTRMLSPRDVILVLVLSQIPFNPTEGIAGAPQCWKTTLSKRTGPVRLAIFIVTACAEVSPPAASTTAFATSLWHPRTRAQLRSTRTGRFRHICCWSPDDHSRMTSRSDLPPRIRVLPPGSHRSSRGSCPVYSTGSRASIRHRTSPPSL